MPAIAFSILRATSVSSCAGEPPGRLALMMMLGTSRSGKFCTFMFWYPSTPAKQSMTKNMMAAIGFLIHQEETFMSNIPTAGCERVICYYFNSCLRNN